MNYKIANRSKLAQLKTEKMLLGLRRLMREEYDKSTAMGQVLDSIKHYFETLGTPSFYKRYLDPTGPVDADDINDTFLEIEEDIDTAYQEIGTIANTILDNFNQTQSSSLGLENRLKELTALSNEYKLLSRQRYNNIIYLSDTFNTTGSIDELYGSGVKAHVSTGEGIVTLKYSGSTNHSPTAQIDHISGNGELGNYRIINPDILLDYTNTLSKSMFFLSYENAHDNINAILDNRPDTWVEYQMTNIPEIRKEPYFGYDLRWARGGRVGSKLRLRIVIKLPEVVNINWINVNPYLPPNHAASKIVVYSISTSISGTEYTPIYGSNTILNHRLNIMPDTYEFNEISDEDLSISKFSSQGVWNFPARDTRFVEIVLDQDESYIESIGLTYYNRIIHTTDDEGRTVEIVYRLPESEVKQSIKDSLPGIYPIGENIYIEKGIEPVAGWRYIIGIRDINIYSHKFATESELISKRYSLEKDIRAVSLDVSEKIPPEILGAIKDRNKWLQYYFSLNDIDWYPMSPTHHRQIGPDPIPPKVYLVNTSVNPTSEVSRGSIFTEEQARHIRFKAIFARPANLSSDNAYSPVLEGYTLRIVTEE